MDYLVLSALLGITLIRIVISYDIGCQWSKKFSGRVEDYPEEMQLAPDTKVEIGIPNWHVNGHGSFCCCYERTLLLRARHILYLHVFDTLTSFT